MDKFSKAIKEINSINDLSGRSRWINDIHPLAKLIITIWYIVTVISFDKFNIIGLLPMVIFPAAIFILGDIPFWASIKRLKIALPLICFMGIFNPIFESAAISFAGREINAGYVSMFTLMLKGVMSVLASYLLIATTSIEKICCALRQVKCPKIIVTEILLIYRYITVFTAEVQSVSNAYSLRAPKQKGIHIKAWGSLVGSILLRSFDRANRVFDSMNMRGYNGEFKYAVKNQKLQFGDIIYILIWAIIFVLFKRIPIILLIGNLIGGMF